MTSLQDFWPWLACLSGMSALLWLLYWIISPGKLVVKEFIYKQTPQANLIIRIYLPSDWAPQNKRPAILFFFGGGWISGDIDHFRWQGDFLARQGIVAALVDYRVDSRHQTTPDKAVSDGFDAFNWLVEHADQLGIDTQKIISSGSSAGGHIAACLALCKNPRTEKMPTARPALLVLFNPVLDLTSASSELEFSPRELELIAMMPPETVTAISPNQHVDECTPPSLLFFGGHDPLSQQGAQFSHLARTACVKIQTEIAPEQKHGFFNREPWRSGTMVVVLQYLKEHGYLGGQPNG